MSGRPPEEPVLSDSPAPADAPAPVPRLRLVAPPAEPPPGPPSDALLAELDALLARPARAACDLDRLVALARRVPGRKRAVVAALAAAGTPTAVAALLDLADVPGALEAVARALTRGLTRAWPTREIAHNADAPAAPLAVPAHDPTASLAPAAHDPAAPREPIAPDPAAPLAVLDRAAPLTSDPAGPLAPVFLALEFRSSRARPFPDLLRRAQLLADAASRPEFVADAEDGTSAAPAVRLDVLRVGERPAYRLSFWPEQLPPRRRVALARALAPDLTRLHARLARLRGTRLWLNGFCFAEHGPVSPAAQAHLLAAWLTWAEREGA